MSTGGCCSKIHRGGVLKLPEGGILEVLFRIMEVEVSHGDVIIMPKGGVYIRIINLSIA